VSRAAPSTNASLPDSASPAVCLARGRIAIERAERQRN
jgi:hypothetical protein